MLHLSLISLSSFLAPCQQQEHHSPSSAPWQHSSASKRACPAPGRVVLCRSSSSSNGSSNGSTSTSSTSTSSSLSGSSMAGTRVGRVARKTKETDVDVEIDLDGTGVCSSQSGIPFLDHMMDQLASHGLFDVRVKAKGDYEIDDHHTNEDIALALGTALSQALGDRKGIERMGNFEAPLDEALVKVVVDLSGRPHLSCNLALPTQRIGTYDTLLVEHFFQSLANTGGITLHITQLAGRDTHHIVEATFKAFARALRRATEVDPRRGGRIASSKGVLTQV